MKRTIAVLLITVSLFALFTGCKSADESGNKEYRFGDKYLSSGSTEDFSYVLYSDHAEITSYIGDATATEIAIPSAVGGKTVTVIGNSAVSDDTYLEKITIPSTVTKIDDSAFFGCTSLGAVNIPSSVNVIGSSAFYGTKWYDSLTDEFVTVGDGVLIKYNGSDGEVMLPKTVKYLSDAFAENTKLTKITVGKSVNGISSYAFYGCSSLGEISIDESISDIGICAFDGTTWQMSQDDGPVIVGDGVLVGIAGDAETVDLPDTVKYISGAFYENETVKTVTVPESVKCVRFASFYNSAVETVTFCGKDTYLESGVFYNCIKLKSVKLPENLTVINDDTFAICSSLRSIDIPSSVEIIGIAALYGSGLYEVNIPNGVKTIASGAFYSCVSLKKVTLPDSVTSLGEAVFSYCTSLTEINIPSSVPTVTPSLFQYDASLKSITVPETVIKISADAFGDCDGIAVTVLGSNTSFEDDVFSKTEDVYGEDETESETETEESMIIAKKGSAAEEYAAKNGIKFEELK